MKALVRVGGAILWPLRAPIRSRPGSFRGAWWAMTCVATVIPLTAAFHYAVFSEHNCMMMLYGQDYTPAVIRKWLLSDLSPYCAVAAMSVVYAFGRRRLWTRIMVAPVFSSLLPFSLWIWDLPFSGRYICRYFHDQRFLLAAGWPLHTGYLLAVGLAFYGFFVTGIIRKMEKSLRTD